MKSSDRQYGNLEYFVSKDRHDFGIWIEYLILIDREGEKNRDQIKWNGYFILTFTFFQI